MEEITKVVHTFNAPIGEIWSVISDFGTWKAWFPGIKKCSLEGYGIGSIRRLTFEETGSNQNFLDQHAARKKSVYSERLEICDPKTCCVSYRILSPNPLPVSECTGTMQLSELGPNKTQLEWTARAEKIDAGAKPALASLVTNSYHGAIEGITRLVGC